MNTTYTLADYKSYVTEIAKQGYWNAVCTCHNNNAKISLENFAKVAFLLQANPSTLKGITAINHDIFRRAGQVLA